MKPATKIGLYIVAASLALGLVLSPFASKTDMSVAGLVLSAVAIPMFFVGAICITVGIVQSLPRTLQRMVYVAVAAGIVVAMVARSRTNALRPHVSRLVLETDSAHYKGPCPATIKLRAHITVDRGTGLVAYTFRGYSPTKSEGEIQFEAPGTKTVTGAITFGMSGYGVAGPGDLKVRIDPPGSPEARAEFRYECTR